ncbi:heat shock protein HtpX [Rhizobium aquaticum]|uniref:Heat shock protein HtpX n=1 Tax=Rhizobium aquaticum TaxID=1549636 RepID=A0ABV2J7S0_9HYPH
MAADSTIAASVRHSTLPTWLSLVFGSWVGLIWGSLISLPIGVGFAVAGGSIFGGFLMVPIWGTVWGLVGLGRQRESAVAQHGVSLLKESDPLAQRVHILAGNLGLSVKPWVGVMPHNNAYAIGSNPDNALVVIGQPLINGLTEDEVNAIIGHELGHVVNNDMRRMGFARSFQNSLVWYLGFSRTVQGWGRWFLTWLSELFVLGLSRKREYWADAIGAILTSKEAMISALEKLHNEPPLSDFERENARLMFRGFASGSMFSTHPTLAERRQALQNETYIRQLGPLRRAVTPLLSPQSPVPLSNETGMAKRN